MIARSRQDRLGEREREREREKQSEKRCTVSSQFLFSYLTLGVASLRLNRGPTSSAGALGLRGDGARL